MQNGIIQVANTQPDYMHMGDWARMQKGLGDDGVCYLRKWEGDLL